MSRMCTEGCPCCHKRSKRRRKLRQFNTSPNKNDPEVKFVKLTEALTDQTWNGFLHLANLDI